MYPSFRVPTASNATLVAMTAPSETETVVMSGGVGAATLAVTGADTLVVMSVANVMPTHVPTMAASDATLVAMTAPS